MKIKINDKTLDTRGVTPWSPLEEQAMLVWYTAHARVAAADDTTAVNRGVQGSFNMHWHIKDLFSCTDDEARAVGSRVRQVLKKTSAARCVSLGGAGHSPIWWVSDTLPDNIITVAEWVTANHKLVGDGDAPYKPTRAEKRLSEHEAGEDRPAEPVTVVKRTGDEVTAEALLMEPQDTETVEVEVEGPVDNPHADRLRRQREQHDRWVAVAMQVVADFGPLSIAEATTLVNIAQNEIQLAVGTVGSVFRDLVRDGVLFTRRETHAERTIRQTEHDKKGGQPAMLYAASSEQLATARGTYVSAYGEVCTPSVVAETKQAQPVAAVTVVINNAASTTAGTYREQMLAIGEAVMALAARLPETSELDDLRVMNGLLEEENARLREQLAREKDRAAKVRELYG